MSACEALSRFRDGSLSPVEVVRALIQRGESLNPKLNAFTEVCAEDALVATEVATARYSGKGECPVHGTDRPENRPAN